MGLRFLDVRLVVPETVLTPIPFVVEISADRWIRKPPDVVKEYISERLHYKFNCVDGLHT